MPAVDSLERVVERFTDEANCGRVIDRLEYFRTRGLVAELVAPALEDQSPVFVCFKDSDEGLIVPPIKVSLGACAAETLLEFFISERRDPGDQIFHDTIGRFPRVRKTNAGWAVEVRGKLDGELMLR